MMYPEMMHIVVKSHHQYLQSLAKGEWFMDDVQNLSRTMRNALGRGMVRTGRWIEGHATTTITLKPTTSLQES